jgi:hypothetical protein
MTGTHIEMKKKHQLCILDSSPHRNGRNKILYPIEANRQNTQDKDG